MFAPTSDIHKKGNLVKLKTMKKKYFVLRETTTVGGPARLEYYDSEKKFKSGAVPKRSIVLSSCFSINTKCDAKHRHTVALFTKDSCFTMVCDSEEEQQGWLQAMLDLRSISSTEDDHSTVPLFDRMWPVTVKDKGVGNGRHLVPGQYRLCLTNTSLGLVRLNHEEPDITFQLDSIRRCANKDKFFFMELGRGCKTGEGELWLQVEDEVIALNMHDNILSSMKTINSGAKQPAPQPFRVRSRSNVDKTTKPVNRSQSMHGGDSSTLPKRSKTLSSGDSGVLRKGSSHSQSKTEVEMRPKPGSKRSSLMSSSPMANKAMSLMVSETDGLRLRTDSMESRASSRGTASSLSADEMDDHGMARSLTPDADSAYMAMAPASKGTLRSDNYLEMSPGETKISVPQSAYMSMQVESTTPTQPVDNYLEMSTTPTATSQLGKDLTVQQQSKGDPYLEMAPGLPDLGSSAYMEMGVSSSASSVMSSASSCHDLDEVAPTGYIDMSPAQGSYLSPVQERLTVDGGYIEMSSPPSLGSSSMHMRASPSLRPDRVVSYLRDEDPKDEFPKRAYSVGSRSSVLDKTLKDSYLGMKVDSAVDQKSSSTPHLLTDKRGSQESVHKRKSNRDLSDLFMEMDFNRDDLQNDLRPRTASTGSSKEFRSGASSGSKEFRSRTSSFGLDEGHQRTASFGKKDKISRLASLLRQNSERHGDGHRPRTATICQDSLRPRTSSFGSADMRPRSSSQGNARLKERFNKINKESLKRSSKVTSTESVSSTTSSDYLDMHPKPGSSPSLGFGGRKDVVESEYIAMERVPERLAASPLVRESIDEGYMAMDLSANQVTLHSSAVCRPKGSKSGNNSKASSSSESLSSSSQSSVDAKPSVSKLMGQGYSEMDFTPRQEAYMSFVPGAGAKDSSKAAKGMDKVTSPIRSDLPQLTEPASHSWMHSKHRKKAPEYINLDYSGEKDVREPLLEGDVSPALPLPTTSKTVHLLPTGPQPKRPEKSRTVSGSSGSDVPVTCAPVKPAPPKLKVPVPPIVKPNPEEPSRPLDPFQLNVKVSTPVPDPPVMAAVEVPIPSRGSCGSLSSMDCSASTLSAGPLGELSKSSQLLTGMQDPAASSLTAQMTTSKTSLVSTDGEIAYAKLDIASSREDPGCLGSSSGALSIKSRHSSSEEAELPLQYAEIDFERTVGK